MKIKQVEELVGISSKNIRFYEDEALLKPERAANGYREYHQKEIERLKRIKLLRMLGISVEEIALIFKSKMALADCLDAHKAQLKKDCEAKERMLLLADEILASHEDIKTLSCDHWLETLEKLKKEGIGFVDIRKIDVKMKKKFGAIICAIIFATLFFAMAIVGSFAMHAEQAPLLPKLLIVLVPSLCALALIIALVWRIKEINGGEEDEASQY